MDLLQIWSVSYTWVIGESLDKSWNYSLAIKAKLLLGWVRTTLRTGITLRSVKLQSKDSPTSTPKILGHVALVFAIFRSEIRLHERGHRNVAQDFRTCVTRSERHVCMRSPLKPLKKVLWLITLFLGIRPAEKSSIVSTAA